MVDKAALGRSPYLPDRSLKRAEAHLSLLIAFADENRPITHVAYPDLIRDPVAMVDSIHAALGVDGSADFADRMNTFVHAQQAGKRAKPPKTLPTFGLEQDAFLSRPNIAAYCRRFGVEPERKRQTG